MTLKEIYFVTENLRKEVQVKINDAQQELKHIREETALSKQRNGS